MKTRAFYKILPLFYKKLSIVIYKKTQYLEIVFYKKLNFWEEYTPLPKRKQFPSISQY